MTHHPFTAATRRVLRPAQVGGVLMLFTLSLPAIADNAADDEILRKMQQMQQQMQTMARQIESLQTELANTQARLTEQQALAPDAAEQPDQTVASDEPLQRGVEVSVDHGHLEAASADQDFKVAIGGRLQFDAAFFDEDEGSIGRGSEIRRARLYVAGTFDRHWSYKNQIDFAGEAVSINDAYLRYSGLPARLTLGNFKEPFSLEELVSARFTTFMERALPNVFAPARNVGLAADMNGRLASRGGWSASLGVFGEGVNDSGFDSNFRREDDEGVGVTGRLTVAPIATDDRLVHLGGAASYRDTGDGTTLRLRQRFESHIADRRLVDTGLIFGVDSLLRTGTEAALAWGPFSLQGEYMQAGLQRSGPEDLDFSGYYVYGSWFLTGESRAAAYSTGSGKFGRLVPNAPVGVGLGGWELATRFSRIDLSDRDIAGGEEENLTVALNWYPTYNVRFGAEYVHVLDVSGGPNDGDEPAAFQMRAQVDF